MRFVGHKSLHNLRAFRLGLIVLFVSGSLAPLLAQTAPYLLPYTMSTFAGPHAAYTKGAACTNTSGSTTITSPNYVALDTTGDGCPASMVEIGTDPHDVRVDSKGNVYWIDDGGSQAVIHKILASSGLETVYLGSVTKNTPCSTGDTYGDGCVATDGAANTTTSSSGHYYTTDVPKSRGLGIAHNGDVFLADYNGDEDHKVSAATGIFSIVAGTGTGATMPPLNGREGISEVNGSRGIGVDSNTGLVYIADTGDDVLRLATPTTPPCTGQPLDSCYTTTTLSYPVTTATQYDIVSGTPIGSEQLDAPEDAKVDSFGNVFFTEQANNIVMAIYNGSGTLPGISNPQTGDVYLIAGKALTAAPPTGTLNTTYPNDGTTPTVPATSVEIGTRKISLDSLNNLYIADGSNNVVWFVDHVTGYMRLLAGRFEPVASGATLPAPVAYGCPGETNTLGDGCPGPDASIYPSVESDPANDADNQGNLYIGDSEGEIANASRIRKLLSGLNFPAVAIGGTPVTQTIQVHFTVGDTPAATAPYTVTNSDFTIGASHCVTNSPGTATNGSPDGDNTTDCTVNITFAPTKTGYDTATLTLTTAGGGVNSYLLTGTGTAPSVAFDPGSVASLTSNVNNAQGVTLDGAGNAYIADTANNRVLLYTAATQAVTVFAGTGVSGYTGDGAAATLATLNDPTAVAIDTTGSVYIADSGNNVIRKVSAAGAISTFGGGATATCSQAIDSLGDGCPATSATFKNPTGITADNLGQIYVADTGNNLIRQINNVGWVSILAGGSTPTSGTGELEPTLPPVSAACTAKTDTQGDGCSGSQAVFNAPAGLAFDATGNFIVVADSGNNIVREIYLANTFTASSGGVVAATPLINPVTLLAGDGSAGDSIDVNGVATLSQLNKPLGVAVDAAENIYIADSANAAIRLVAKATGTISTIAGIDAAPGLGTVPGPATGAQLTTPGGIAIANNGLLYIADSGNNRVLTDSRAQISFNFGVLAPNTDSAPQTFTELSIGTTAAKLSSPLVVASGDTTQFSFTEPTGSAGCAAGETLAPGATCTFVGEFTPSTVGRYSATYTETGATSAGGTPSINLTGVSAILTSTTSSVAQTVPATGNSQFGGSVTLSVTVSAPCNTAALSCYPDGTVQIIVDGVKQAPLTLSATGTASQSFTGLSVGPHTVSCSYSGDNVYYGSSTCPDVTITVGQASTTSLLSATNNNQPQFPTSNCVPPTTNQPDTVCTATVLTATVISDTSGIPTGSVTFYASGGAIGSTPTALGTAVLNSTTGVANLPLAFQTDPNGDLVANTTLGPGTYSLTCTYSGASNFATSNCAPVTYTVVAQSANFTLTPVGCVYTNLVIAGTDTPGYGVTCQSTAQLTMNGYPLVATADGSTTDATIFITPSNTASGTLTFSCSGLPQYSACTFSPTSVTLTPGSTYDNPIYTDMTLWTDIQPGNVPASTTASLRGPSLGSGSSGVRLAIMLGWPLTLFGLLGLSRLRRKPGNLRGLTLLALLLVMSGSSLIFTGCGGGPGAYQPVLTPAGTYPITVTVTGGGITKTTTVYFKVSSPGIAGQE